MAPLVRRANGTIEEPSETIAGLPLGVTDALGYEQCDVEIGPGDTLTLYTDGINESIDASGALLHHRPAPRARQKARRRREAARAGHRRRRPPLPRQGPAKRRHVPGLLWPAEGVIRENCAPTIHHSCHSARSADRILWNTPDQSPGLLWRNSRMVGYQGVVSPCNPQRAIGNSGDAIHTGRPSAPAT